MSWYKDGLKFECTRCGNCCTGAPGYVWISIPELYRIAEFLGLRFRDFAKNYVRKVNGRLSLKEFPNGDCVFYNKGCQIYPVRPMQCRSFPFWSEILRTPGTWQKASEECPGINQGKTFSEREIKEFL